jgi:steroid delta-isomerase-like uncharacterized protein
MNRQQSAQTPNTTTFREAHQSFNQRDFETLKQKVSADLTYRDHATDRVFQGRDEWINQWLQAWIEGFPDARVEDVTYLDAGETVVALATGRGTNEGSFAGFPSTGKRIELPICEVVRFNDAGQIVSGEAFYDQMTVLKQLGHLEEMLAT